MIITRIIKEIVTVKQTTTQLNAIAVEPKDTQDLNVEEVRMLSVIVVIKKDTSQTCARQKP